MPNGETERAHFARAGAWLEEPVVSPESGPPEQMGKLYGYLKGLHATYLIDLGARLGLFQELHRHDGAVGPAQLSSALGLDAGYTQIWCEAACALELLDYDPREGYALASGVDDILGDPGGAFYLGSFPEAHLQVARDYARYGELLRSGGTHAYAAHDEPFLRGIAAATSVLPRMFMSAVLPQLPELQAQLEAGARILDVGCGAGYAVVEFASGFPGVSCVGVDADAVSVSMASELVKERELESRIDLDVVDATALPENLAGQFDLVTMFLVLHEIEPAKKDAVLAQCWRALRPGGRLMIFDERYPGSPLELRDPTQIYAVMAQWYELTWGNELETREAIRDRLERQQFTVESEADLSRFYIVTAERTA